MYGSLPDPRAVSYTHLVRDKKIADVAMTGGWELALSKIATGEMDASEVSLQHGMTRQMAVSQSMQTGMQILQASALELRDVYKRQGVPPPTGGEREGRREEGVILP